MTVDKAETYVVIARFTSHSPIDPLNGELFLAQALKKLGSKIEVQFLSLRESGLTP